MDYYKKETLKPLYVWLQHILLVAASLVLVSFVATASTLAATPGSVGPWQTNTNPLPQPRYVAAAVTANNYAYVMGGYNGSNYQNTVYYAFLNPKATAALPVPTTNPPTAPDTGYGQLTSKNILPTLLLAAGTIGLTVGSTLYYRKSPTNIRFSLKAKKFTR